MSFTTPTYLAVKTATSRSLEHSKRRVISLYRQWQRAAPEIVETYALVIPVSAVRSRIRQEFERHRYVQELSVIDVLIFKGTAEYQETMNFWKFDPYFILGWGANSRQRTHVMQYFRDIEEPRSRLPSDFVGKFLEGKA